MKYRFINTYRSAYGVERMCRVLNASRSGYYGWRRRPLSKRKKDNDRLPVEIREIHGRSRGRYGSPRITEDLWEKGNNCGKNRVARLMRTHGIVGRAKRKFKATTNSKHNLPVAPNFLGQNFKASAPNKVWVSDLTYIATREGWLYLAVIIDVFSRQVVGWGMSDRLTADVVIKALYQAIGRRRPAPGLIFHSDQGVQYAVKTSAKFSKSTHSCRA
jgi:transposase InsO family protein